MEDKDKNIYITSHNQSGGITAHTVVYGQGSELTEPYQKLLLSSIDEVAASMPLGKNTPISIMYEQSSARAQKLSSDIRDFLKSKAYTLGGSGMGSFGVREGVTVWKEQFSKGNIDIIVKF